MTLPPPDPPGRPLYQGDQVVVVSCFPFLSHVFNPRTALLTAIVITIVITIVIRPWDGHAEVVIGVIGALVVIGAIAVIRAIAVNRRRDGNHELVEAANRRLELSQLVGHIE